MTKKKAQKVVVFGIDSATFDYIDPLVAQGKLPNIERLMDAGTRSILRSIHPYMTPAAWPSMFTGFRPEKHGILGWFTPLSDTYELTPVCGRDIKKRAVWNYLSEAGYSVGVYNVPLTYPAEEVHGKLIVGFDSPFWSPNWTSGMTHPEDYWSEVLKRHGSYKFVELVDETAGDPVLDPHFWASAPDEHIDWSRHIGNWATMETTRHEVIMQEVAEQQPDLLWVVYHIVDYFGHRAARDSQAISEAYKMCDTYLGELMDSCDEETTFLLVSDHGMNEIDRFFYVHNWLDRKGYMAFHPQVADIQMTSLAALLNRSNLGEVRKHYREKVLRNWLELYEGSTGAEKTALWEALKRRWPGINVSHTNIDWAKTQVFTMSPYGEFYMNIRGIHRQGTVTIGAEYDALVERLIADLTALIDPFNERPVMSRVHKGAEFYTEFEYGKMPDVVCEKADYGCAFNHFYQHYLHVSDDFGSRRDMDPRFRTDHFGYVGDHTPFGICVAKGPGIAQHGQVPPMNITDITPTLLALFGIEVDDVFDGAAAPHIAVGARATTATLHGTERQKVQAARGVEEEEFEYLRQTLRKLGYKL